MIDWEQFARPPEDGGPSSGHGVVRQQTRLGETETEREREKEATEGAPSARPDSHTGRHRGERGALRGGVVLSGLASDASNVGFVPRAAVSVSVCVVLGSEAFDRGLVAASVGAGGLQAHPALRLLEAGILDGLAIN